MSRLACWLPLFVLLLSGCQQLADPDAKAAPRPGGDSTVLLSITSNAAENPQAVDMALKLAGFSLDEGRRVALFFNVQGVLFPTKNFDAEAAFQDNEPLVTQLNSLIDRGADVHVCPVCMTAMNVDAADILAGAQVTTRPKLFAHIGPDTAVFTY